MKMRDNIPEPVFFSAEESPIPVPSIEGSWSLMRKKLDNQMPSRVGWWRSSRWFVLAGAIVVVVSAWLAYSHNKTYLRARRPGVSRVNSPRASSLEKLRQDAVVDPAVNSGVNPAVNSAVNHALNPAVNSTVNHVLNPAVNHSVNPAVSRQGVPVGNPSGGSQAGQSDQPDQAGAAPANTSMRPLTGASGRRRSRASVRNRSGSRGHSSSAYTPDGVTGKEDLLAYVQLPASFLLPYPFQAMTDTVFPVRPHYAAESGKDGSSSHGGASVKGSGKASGRGGPGMAAGLSISKSFPIASQQAYPYNINAKGNLLSDYIPAPYFQWYLRKNLYLQLAFQINSPQYTAASFKHSSSSSSALDTVNTDVTLKKLYYTDIPLTVHYAPFKHLFIGAGLQLSMYRGGVALQNEQNVQLDSGSAIPQYTNTSEAVKLNDSLQRVFSLRKTDWRILFDIQYNWRRAAIGFRFQEPLTNYLKNIPSGSPGRARNTSLGLYLQYNLWERKRKD